MSCEVIPWMEDLREAIAQVLAQGGGSVKMVLDMPGLGDAVVFFTTEAEAIAAIDALVAGDDEEEAGGE